MTHSNRQATYSVQRRHLCEGSTKEQDESACCNQCCQHPNSHIGPLRYVHQQDNQLLKRNTTQLLLSKQTGELVANGRIFAPDETTIKKHTSTFPDALPASLSAADGVSGNIPFSAFFCAASIAATCTTRIIHPAGGISYGGVSKSC